MKERTLRPKDTPQFTSSAQSLEVMNLTFFVMLVLKRSSSRRSKLLFCVDVEY